MTSTPNVILIVLDTMRGDTVYSHMDKTVAIKKLADDGVVYHNAIAPSSWTIPSHASIFTGLYPSEHRVHRDLNEPDLKFVKNMNNIQRTLPEMLRKTGYTTKSFHANTLLSSGSGFEKGFDLCENIGPFADSFNLRQKLIEEFPDLFGLLGGLSSEDKLKKIIFSGKIGTIVKALKALKNMNKVLKQSGFPDKKGADRIIDLYLNQMSTEPTFDFVNLMEAHEPYDRVPMRPVVPSLTESGNLGFMGVKSLQGSYQIKTRRIERARNQYNGSLLRIDQQLTKLLKGLKEAGKYEDSLIILTSDHGQELMENGYFGHQIFLYDTIVKVPLIIKYPKSKRYNDAQELRTLTDLFDLVINWTSGDDVEMQSREFVFSESYGMSKGEIARITNKQFSGHEGIVKRKAVFHKDYKVTVDGEHGRVEQLAKKGVPLRIEDNERIVSSILQELEFFTGNENFALPEF